MESLSKYELAPYLPYELKIKNGDEIETLNNIHGIETYQGTIWYCKTVEGNFISVKLLVPLLKPLKSFKDFEEILDELSQIEFESIIEGLNCLDVANYRAINMMIKHHIDVFGLIDKGLALDSTLLKNKVVSKLNNDYIYTIKNDIQIIK